MDIVKVWQPKGRTIRGEVSSCFVRIVRAEESKEAQGRQRDRYNDPSESQPSKVSHLEVVSGRARLRCSVQGQPLGDAR